MQAANSFNKIINSEGEPMYSVYSSKIPSLLTVRLDHAREVAYIEFTARILKDDYSKLISTETIRIALNNVAERVNCVLEVEAIINDAKVLLIDVTKDIPLSMTEQVKQTLYMSVSNVKKWRPEKRKQNGIDVAKSVKGKSKCRERISLYCKVTELGLSRNRNFCNSLTACDELLNHFAGKTRVEYNLSSSYMIRKALKIEDVLLKSVLNSTANPLLNIYNRIFDHKALPELATQADYGNFKTLGEYLKNLLLKEYDDDVMKAEQVYRHFHSPKSHFSAKRKELVRIRNIRKSLLFEPASSKQLIKEIANKLS
ncbi:MAG: hypothetical protein OJF59_000577 [Cytophagales bacterium]|nr:hypothetical protein [Bacteroidota bacterium]WHZ06824.1 MAG: hypothetical protein OJF59_000577 [Cytophagales bacterium]